MGNIDPLISWLISEGRLLGDETQIVKGYCERLLDLGVPLARARIAQNYSNPLLSAWGIIWTPEETRRYTVATTVLSTSAWQGSPFEYIVTHRRPLRKRIMDLDLAAEHPVYADLAKAGATDFLAVPLEHGTGTVQSTSYTSNARSGFSDHHIEYIVETRHALAAALERIARRNPRKAFWELIWAMARPRKPVRDISVGANIKRFPLRSCLPICEGLRRRLAPSRKLTCST